MINLKVGSLIKLVGSKYDDIQYVPAVNSITLQHHKLPIGNIGMIVEINNTGKDPPGYQDIVFLYEDQLYETYHTFVEPL